MEYKTDETPNQRKKRRADAENTVRLLVVLQTGQELTEIFLLRLLQLSLDTGAQYDLDTPETEALTQSAFMEMGNHLRNMFHLQMTLMSIYED